MSHIYQIFNEIKEQMTIDPYYLDTEKTEDNLLKNLCECIFSIQDFLTPFDKEIEAF